MKSQEAMNDYFMNVQNKYGMSEEDYDRIAAIQEEDDSS